WATSSERSPTTTPAGCSSSDATGPLATIAPVTEPTATQIRVVFPGEPGSFAEDAALAYFGADAPIDRLPGFADVVEAVARGEVDRGVVPIENVVFGTVQQVQDLLAASDVVIVGEV